MAHSRDIHVKLDDQTPHKWIIPLTEEAFQAFMSKGDTTVHRIFGDGSFFSPLLFGKFFDPSDAFPLWDFEANVLLSRLRSSGCDRVDWFQTDHHEFILQAELPGKGEDNTIQICVEKGKILEISGMWKPQRGPSRDRDWRSSNWWEHGFVRRIELPENANWRHTLAKVKNDVYLEIIIPMKDDNQ